jgi:hypothetical protein
LGERQTEDLVVACSNQAWGIPFDVLFLTEYLFYDDTHQVCTTVYAFMHQKMLQLVQFSGK